MNLQNTKLFCVSCKNENSLIVLNMFTSQRMCLSCGYLWKKSDDTYITEVNFMKTTELLNRLNSSKWSYQWERCKLELELLLKISDPKKIDDEKNDEYEKLFDLIHRFIQAIEYDDRIF